jgi:formylglycine-generating enzyme required for sulfatase activity
MRAIGVYTVALLALVACSDPNAEANKLFVEATQRIEQAQSEQDARKLLNLLTDAHDRIEKIIKSYATESIAVQLASGQAIGNISRTNNKENKEAAELLVEAATLIEQAQREQNPWRRAIVLREVVGSIEKIGERHSVTVVAARWLSRQATEAISASSLRDCDVCPEMMAIPAGSFTMGSPNNEPGRDSSEGPQHWVTIPQPFAVGKFEVTFEQWDVCVAQGGCAGYRPSDEGWGRGHRPAINVTWSHARQYIDWLSGKTGKSYRLLSEAEWEYAARAGTTPAWSCGAQESCVGEIGWFGGHANDRTQPVGGKRANGFGLHDMAGNVWEWVEDCWHRTYAGAPLDGSAWVTGGDCGQRVLRGGSWDDLPRDLRSANRDGDSSDHRYLNIGFRVARTLEP